MATAATNLNSGVASEVHWTDNLFSDTEDEVDDYSARLSPWAEITDPDGNVTWGVRYVPAYEQYLDETDLSGFDHDVYTRFGWRLNGRTTLRVGDRFQRYHSLARFNEQADPGEDVVVAGRRARYTKNLANASLEYLLTPRDFFLLNAAYTTQRFSESGQRDREYLSTGLLYHHRMSTRTIVGASAAWTRQTIEEDVLDDRETDYFNVNAIFAYELSPTLHFEAALGPALILSDPGDTSLPATVNRATFPIFTRSDGPHFVDADTCPRNGAGIRVLVVDCETISPPLTVGQLSSLGANVSTVPVVGSVPDVDDSSTTYFADISLAKEWERTVARIGYRRSEDRSTGASAGTSDSFYGSLEWKLAQRINAVLQVSYDLREQESEGIVFVTQVSNEPTPLPAFPLAAQAQAVSLDTVASDSGLDVLTTNLHIAYLLTRRSSLYTNITYRDEQTSGDVFVERAMQRFGISFGIRYAFEPIEF